MTQDPGGRIWRVRVLRNDHEWQGPLVAYWEVHMDPMSEDYDPSEIDAAGLLRKWAGRVRELYANEQVPIYWYVESPGQGKFEEMPFQVTHDLQGAAPVKDFLTIYTWPTDSRTDQPLNWLALPVVDKQWNENRADKGGFIQEATGWKPGVLQPVVYLPALLSVLRQS